MVGTIRSSILGCDCQLKPKVEHLALVFKLSPTLPKLKQVVKEISKAKC